MKDSTRKALIEIGTTLTAFAIEVWRKLTKNEDEKKGGRN